MPDDWELLYGLDPQDPFDAIIDFDGDELTNLQEFINGTDPWNPDSDNDGLFDGDEVLFFGTKPNNADSDNDGIADGYEIDHQLNPINPDDALFDKDGDGLTNLQEFQFGTSASIIDSDYDSITDGDEVNQGLNPADKDTDDDGLDDGDELSLGTSPLLRDSDSDNVIDGFQYGTIIRVNPQRSLIEPGNGQSSGASLSADGRYMVFVSESSNIVSNDTNGVIDVFWSDTLTGEVRRISVSSNGIEGNDWSGRIVNGFGLDISDDGQYVVFQSSASNLDANDTNNITDIFVHEVQTSTTTMVSVNSDGLQSNQSSWNPSISADGRYVVFDSGAKNWQLGADGSAGTPIQDVFLHDRQTGQTTLVSKSTEGVNGNNHSTNAVISGNGRFVAYTSRADNLVANDNSGIINDINNDYYGMDVFVHDLQRGTTERVSIATDGTDGDHLSDAASISADGRYVAFHSLATTLDTNVPSGYNVFVHDRDSKQTKRITIDNFEGDSYNFRQFPSISSSGRYIALRASKSSGNAVFVYDQDKQQTRLVSRNNNGLTVQSSIGNSLAISADGQFVGFSTSQWQLVPDKTDSYEDVFMTATGFTAELAVAPTAVITAVDTAFTNTPVLFDASLSVDPNGDPLLYFWNFGEGFNSGGINTYHTYTTPGTYTVTLAVNDGETATSTTKVITVLVDSDGDGIEDSLDLCPYDDESGWVSEPSTDFDGDGCHDFLEDNDDDNDGLYDTYETAYGLDPVNATGNDGAAGDLDNDGFTNLEEQATGSAANSATSNPGTIKLSSTSYSVNEDAGSLSIPVSRDGGTVGDVSVTCFSSFITATPNVDYVPVNELLEWADGDSTAKNCIITINTDSEVEGDETLRIDLSDPTGGAKLGETAPAEPTPLL